MKENERALYLETLEINDLTEVLAIKLFGLENPNSTLNEVVNKSHQYIGCAIDRINEFTSSGPVNEVVLKKEIIRLILDFEDKISHI